MNQRNFESNNLGLEVIEVSVKIPIHKNIAMKISFGINLLMRCSVNIASKMVQVLTNKV